MISPGDIVLVLTWILLIFFLHLSLFPLFKRILPAIAVPASFSISLLFFTLSSFWVVFLHLPIFLSLIPFLVIAAALLWLGPVSGGKSRLISVYSGISDNWRYYALFGLVFLSMLLLRLYSPDISNAEKFMDHGFIASIMRNPVIPPLDPWFAGGDLSVYYYLGHWMLGSMGLITGVPSNNLFTLALPTIAAYAAVNMYGLGHLLLPRFRLLPVVFLFIINPAFAQLALMGTEWGKLLWDSTRVIDGTINEYPLFSFIFGDVHAHVLGFLPQTTLLLLSAFAITSWTKLVPTSRILLILLTGLALGSIPPTNTWDILVQAPLIIITGIILLGISAPTVTNSDRQSGPVYAYLHTLYRSVVAHKGGDGISAWFGTVRGAVLYILLVPATGIIVFLPFYLMMKAQGIEGVGFVTSPSYLVSFLLVNGWFLLIISISLISFSRRNPWFLLMGLPFFMAGYPAAAVVVILLAGVVSRHQGVEDLFAGVGLVILLFCELFYLKDSMGDQYFRMNTVFKLYLTAWLFFSVAAACMLGKLLITHAGRVAGLVRVLEYGVPVILLLLLFLPGYVTITHAGPHTPTLDGLSWLSAGHEDDLAAVTWLREQKGNLTLVEAEGGDYGYFSRVSSFTGIPAVLGWPFHESMWRKNTPPGWYGDRTRDIREIYEDPSRTVSLMKSYGVDLLYAGPGENEKYSVSLPEKGLKPVFQHGAVTIYGLD